MQKQFISEVNKGIQNSVKLHQIFINNYNEMFSKATDEQLITIQAILDLEKDDRKQRKDRYFRHLLTK